MLNASCVALLASISPFLLAAAPAPRTPTDGGADAAVSSDAARRDYWERLRAEVRRHTSGVEACYEPALDRVPCAAGTITLRFDFGTPDGKLEVSSEQEGSLPPDVVSCVEARARRWPVPRPPQPLLVRYPLVLKPRSPPGPAASCEAQILAPVQYAGSQLPHPFKPGGWQALCSSKGFDSIKGVAVSFKPYFDEVAGDKPGQKTGREVKARGCDAPIAILRDVHGVVARSVERARVTMMGKGDKRMAHIAFGNAQFLLSVESGPGETARLVLSHNILSHTLLPWSGEAIPSEWDVRWAGDLDGDGKLDLIIEEKDEWGALRLFMSGAATKTHDVGLVAETSWGGC